jgi:hypothetical protein
MSLLGVRRLSTFVCEYLVLLGKECRFYQYKHKANMYTANTEVAQPSVNGDRLKTGLPKCSLYQRRHKLSESLLEHFK